MVVSDPTAPWRKSASLRKRVVARAGVCVPVLPKTIPRRCVQTATAGKDRGRQHCVRSSISPRAISAPNALVLGLGLSRGRRHLGRWRRRSPIGPRWRYVGQWRGHIGPWRSHDWVRPGYDAGLPGYDGGGGSRKRGSGLPRRRTGCSTTNPGVFFHITLGGARPTDGCCAGGASGVVLAGGGPAWLGWPGCAPSSPSAQPAPAPPPSCGWCSSWRLCACAPTWPA